MQGELLCAISTAGSIVGTFACGYFLLSWMGSSRILYGLAALLLALSFIAAVDFRVGHRVGAAIFLLLAAGLAEFKSRQQSVAGFLDIDTAYQRLQVIDTHEEHTGRPVRLLKAEEANTQSAIYLDGNQLLSGYLRYFELIRQADRPLRRVLMIGSAGGVYPMHLARQMPALRIDVVEIDPEVTAIASRYFGLQQSARLRVFHEDGRTYVNRAARQSPGVYDAIYIDAFQTRVPPFQLLTREFAANLQALLSPQGIVALNFIASPSAGSAGLAPAVLRTFAAALPAVALYRVDPQVPQDEVQNLVLLASKIPLSFGATNSGDASRPLPVEADYRRDSSLLLTDDFAPVEYLVSDP
ncbi:MAG: fused MFS/spermidine synthase [Bryobacterales bacterium]|nr:fused MFS/spermidine synthase [Bryobacterales bacterium]